MSSIIVKLEGSPSIQQSLEGCKIQRIVSTISPITFVRLLHEADNKVNPRTATVNKITKSIHETLERSPELFWFKSKGLLLSTEECIPMDRNRFKITLGNLDYEGIMDGGHNTFAIASYIIKKLFGKSLKNWDDTKTYWNKNYEEILSEFLKQEEKFNFSIPIEILTPTDTNGAVDEFYDFISEICSARNNNVQLKETAKGNQVGYYEVLKEKLQEKYDITWKSGEKGNVKSEDVISLASLGLIFLKGKDLLPKDLKSLNKVSIYSQKGKCVDFFNDILGHSDISDLEKGKYILKSNVVQSVLSLTEDIMCFFDRVFIEFPDLYHNAAPGRFGRISQVEMKKESKAPFGTTDEKCDYSYPYGYFYPLVCGLTNLMSYDEENEQVIWRINPKALDLKKLELSQYVELIKIVNYDPQKVGKGVVFYNEAEAVFDKIDLI